MQNVGFEKMICYIIVNPNIRYLVLGGPESEGHLTGEVLKALVEELPDESLNLGLSSRMKKSVKR